MADGFNAEGALSSAQGVKATSESYWMARVESSQNEAYSDEENMDSLFKVMEEIGELNVNECIVYDELVEEAIKAYRRMANSS